MVTTLRLTELRDEVDRLDVALVALLAQRFDLIEQIGKVKMQSGLPVRDVGREQRVLTHVKEAAAEHGLSADLVQTLFCHLMAHAADQQEKQACT
jgi:chorismate mutase-like protein